MLLLVGVDENLCPKFAEIQWIVIYNNFPIIICSFIVTLGYYEHIRAYEIMRKDKKIAGLATFQINCLTLFFFQSLE